MRGNAVFADAFNYLLYDGRAVIEPENLKEMDPAGIALPFGARDGKESRKGKVSTWRCDKTKGILLLDSF